MFLPLVLLAAFCGFMEVSRPTRPSRSVYRFTLTVLLLCAIAMSGPFAGLVMSARGRGFGLALCGVLAALLYFAFARTRAGNWPVGGIVIAALAWYGTAFLVFMSRAGEA